MVAAIEIPANIPASGIGLLLEHANRNLECQLA
jgi:hypothetical protein